MKIRIFALAKELGLDSKELIEYAAQAGVEVKNSALASISPEERDLVLAHLKSAKSAPAGASTAVRDEPMSPVRRDPMGDRGKVRKIEAPARVPRQEPSGPERRESADAPPAVAAESADQTGDAAGEQEREIATMTGTAVAEPPEDEALDEAGSEEEAVSGEAESATDEDAETAVEARTATSEDSSTAGPEVSAPPAAGEPERSAAREGGPIRPIAIRPDEGGRRGVRDMRPVGTVQTNAQRSGKKESADKERKRPVLARPAVAAPPKFTPSRPKADANEAPAQKPDVPLKPGMMQDRASPLSAHLASRGTEKKGPARRGGGGGVAREMSAEEREQDALKAKRKGRPGRRSREDDDDGRRGRTLHRNRSRRGPVAYTSTATIEFPITIRSLSEAMGRPAKQLMTVLFKQGQMVSINDVIDEEAAIEIAMDLGVELNIKRERDLEAELAELLEPDDDESVLETRPPIVTILGHVDHGKTTLLDKIRQADVAGGEAGGITQHIAAYQVEHNGHRITFVDTPGHAAFGEMRARGANVTDVVVLVVAADDGVMPQTEECISHAKAAGVPMIVALNKMDLPGADANKALQGLAARDVLPAEWGGDTEVVRTSGATGDGLSDLLDTILISTELRELKASPDRPGVGVCLEAFRDEGRGPVAWLMVQNGTLSVGDVILCGSAYGRVRAMYDDRDQELEEVGPSTPVKVAGLESVPISGSHFFVLEDIEDAREIAEVRQRTGRAETLASLVHRPRSLEEILETARGGEVQDLPLIIKADTGGSIEAIRHELDKFEHPEVRIRLLHTGVGGVNESDVSLASASGAVIVAFQVVPDDRAQSLAEREGVEIRRYSIIYEVMDSIRQRLEGMLKPEQREVMTGRAIVLQTFKISRTGTIAGCRVLNGTIERNNRIHLIRQQTLINSFGIASLRREKDDSREVREGMECGIRLENFNDIKEGDLLEAFRIEQVKRTLD
ncbi:MAG: translation initiation factor IF-2 [Planctomycetaceae bacterium]|nr:translation initiation factor IF-2 [Planctomycetaceae bacterium]